MRLLEKIAPFAALVALGVLAYANSIDGSFIWDDNTLIADNAVIKNFSNIPSIFVSDNIVTPTGKTFHFFRPIQIITYMIDYSRWGLNPKGYHLTNIILHVLVAFALYWFVGNLYRDKLLALACAAIFIVHPIHTEAVSYISGRADPLATLFVLVSFVCYVSFLSQGGLFFYAAIFLSYMAALLSRENSLIFPVLILVYHYVFRRKARLSVFLPLLIMTAAYIFLRTQVLIHLLPEFNVKPATTVLDRLPRFFVAVTRYMKLLVAPLNLHMEYGNKIFKMSEPAAVAGAAIFFGGIIFAITGRRLEKGLLSFSVLFFAAALVPVSNVYPIGAYMAEHWLYLPSIGFFLLVAWAFRKICSYRYLKAIGVVAFVSVVACCLYLTIMQNSYWKDPVEFYERTLMFSPESIRANNDLAIAYEKMGKHQDAIEIYRELIKIDPRQPDVYVNLGAVYVVTGQTDYAIAACEKAIALEPNNATAHNNLAVALYMKGEYKRAIEECDLALKYGYKVNPKLFELLGPYRE
ncbi:MAG: tetratricopeptide repeat protein [Candidatus Omnitrophica bacterium]|nr:tetratricopeptide repeat protein [Candidatus Omnitrophota bacterium]